MAPPRPPRGSYLARMRAGGMWPPILVLVGCALVLSLLVASRAHSQFALEAVATVQTNKAKMDRLDRLLLLMVDAETSVRGYLVTHNPEYLEPYQDGLTAIDPLLAALDKDFPPDDADRAELTMLTQLVAMKRAVLADAAQTGRIAASTEGQSGPGKAYMDQIRTSIAALRERRTTTNSQLVAESVQRLEDTRRGVTVLALGALGLILALFGVQQRQARLRSHIAELLEHENAQLESTVAQRTHELSDLASYLTNAREAERGRLARELHDELGALLTAAKMDAGWLLRSLGDEAGPGITARFRRLIETIGSGITLKRRIIDDLRPPLLQGLGLVEALRALADTLRVEVPVEAVLPDIDPNPPEEQSLALFRIAQESFTNIRKYAHASHVELGLAVDGDEIRLWVEDDGQGFNPDSPQLSRHGLAGMKHRVQMFAGQLTVRSAPGAGTRIEARMPLCQAPAREA